MADSSESVMLQTQRTGTRTRYRGHVIHVTYYDYDYDYKKKKVMRKEVPCDQIDGMVITNNFLIEGQLSNSLWLRASSCKI